MGLLRFAHRWVRPAASPLDYFAALAEGFGL